VQAARSDRDALTVLGPLLGPLAIPTVLLLRNHHAQPLGASQRSICASIASGYRAPTT
jgi:hypothetical protein